MFDFRFNQKESKLVAGIFSSNETQGSAQVMEKGLKLPTAMSKHQLARNSIRNRSNQQSRIKVTKNDSTNFTPTLQQHHR